MSRRFLFPYSDSHNNGMVRHRRRNSAMRAALSRQSLGWNSDGVARGTEWSEQILFSQEKSLIEFSFDCITFHLFLIPTNFTKKALMIYIVLGYCHSVSETIHQAVVLYFALFSVAHKHFRYLPHLFYLYIKRLTYSYLQSAGTHSSVPSQSWRYFWTMSSPLYSKNAIIWQVTFVLQKFSSYVPELNQLAFFYSFSFLFFFHATYKDYWTFYSPLFLSSPAHPPHRILPSSTNDA